MNHAELLKRALPPGVYDLTAPNLTAELEAEGAVLDKAQTDADNILNEIDPGTAYSLLPDWERVLGLTELSASLGLSLDQRRAAAAAKYYHGGGQSIPYLIKLAEIYGFPGATITEFRQATCNDTCNDALYSEADIYCWQMNLPAAGGQFYANCNSPCDAPVGSWGTGAIEAAIRIQRRAHTSVIFNYV